MWLGDILNIKSPQSFAILSIWISSCHEALMIKHGELFNCLKMFSWCVHSYDWILEYGKCTLGWEGISFSEQCLDRHWSWVSKSMFPLSVLLARASQTMLHRFAFPLPVYHAKLSRATPLMNPLWYPRNAPSNWGDVLDCSQPFVVRQLLFWLYRRHWRHHPWWCFNGSDLVWHVP